MTIKKVLIVDDSEADHIIAKHSIVQYDDKIEVVSAFDGKEALDILFSMDEKPDIIFLDINMPGMNGHEFLEVYSTKNYKSSIVIMLTTSNQEEDRRKSMQYNFVQEYILKPLEGFDVRTVANTFKKL